MKTLFEKTSPAERSALVQMVKATAWLFVVIGRAIKDPSQADDITVIYQCSEEFVDAIIGVRESEEEAAKESYR